MADAPPPLIEARDLSASYGRVQALKPTSLSVAEGEFEVVDIQVATFAILALLTGLTTWYRPGGRLTKEAIVAAHEKLVLSGVSPLAAPPAARARRRPARSVAAH